MRSSEARERSTWGRGRSVVVRKSPPTAFAALVLIAGLVLGISTAAGAPPRNAARSAGSAGPPVITENFKPVLACNPNNTIGMEGCGERRVIAADSELNADVKVIFELLKGGTARRDFVSAQTTWLAYRNADCRSQSDAYSGGSEQPVLYVDCLAGDDSARRADLKGFFALLTQDRENVPKFP
jgi:uncharacterized protein YecT (DUF1311 family)